MSDLKPCPFCPDFSKAVPVLDIFYDVADRTYYGEVACRICGARGPLVEGHYEREVAEIQAREAWNRRVDEEETEKD